MFVAPRARTRSISLLQIYTTTPSSLFHSSSGTINFNIPASPVWGIDFRTATLVMHVELTKDGGGPVVAQQDAAGFTIPQNVSVVPAPALAVFGSCQISFNGTVVGKRVEG